MHYIKGKGRNLLESIKVRDKTQSELRDQDFIGWRNFMEGKVATSVMNLQEKYCKQICSKRPSLIWSGILSIRNIETTQAMWKERNRFLHPLLPNGLGVNEYNIIKMTL